ncbi:unnamed protein product, partial [Coregonus sp. 'balchen']
EEEVLVVEGLLNIYWGLRRPIRLQMHDDNERLQYGGVNRYTHTHTLGLCSLEEDDEEVPQLLRTRSDASFMGVTRRSKTHTHSDLQHLRTHRFSINGHFYNHKVAQYINFEMPVLDSFVEKLKEEEEREISKLTRKYSTLKTMILQQLEGVTDTTDR